jgi:hypothetical protein
MYGLTVAAVSATLSFAFAMLTSFRLSLALCAASLAAILAGCGGGATGESPQVLNGNGFTYSAPTGWKVTRTDRKLAASEGRTDLVSVQVFPLTHAYRPALFAAASGELDRVAGELASGLRGKVTRSATVTVAGRRARQYVVTYRGLVQEVTFVLVDRREYQLLCRRASDADAAHCATLVRSFRLA